VQRVNSGLGAHLISRGLSHRLHAIHFKGASSSSPGCAAGTAAGTALAETGAPYLSLARAFGGGSHDLCQDSWSGLMSDLVEQISVAAQGQKVELSSCSAGGVALQRVVVRQGSYSKNIQGSESGAVILRQATAESPATVQLESAFLQQLIQNGELDGSQGYSLQVNYMAI
jgi:hypothetical protein